jgi:hypothetical protein
MAFVLKGLERYEEAHAEADEAFRMFTALGSKGNAASTYDTKAQIYLAEERWPEAEQAALASVQLLHGGDEYSLLAGSLVTLGVVYARRGSWARARRAFEDAYLAANHVGDKGGAGDALLAWLEELGGEMLLDGFMEIYRRAEEALRDSPRQTVQKRLREVSRKKLQRADSPLFSYAPPPEKAEGEPEKVNWAGFSLSRAVLEFEERYITLALKESGGLVSRAAQFLGLSHQNLSTKLQTRHRNLVHARKPPRKTRSDKLPKEPEQSGD